MWRGLLLAVLVWTAAASLFPFEFVTTTRDYLTNLRLAAHPTVDWQTPLHAAVWFLLGMFAVLSTHTTRPLATARRWGLVLAVSCLLIELCQALVPHRHPDVVDLIVDVAAAWAGVLVATGTEQKPQRKRRVLVSMQWGACAAFVVASLTAAMFTVVGHLRMGFDNWDEKMPLVLGNELTGDRPWRGRIDDVAIYPVALTRDQVAELARRSPRTEQGLQLRRQFGAVVAYPRVTDDGLSWVNAVSSPDDATDTTAPRSDTARYSDHDPLRLVDAAGGAPPATITAPAGLQFRRNLLRSADTASAVCRAAVQSNELTVEVSCAPQRVDQDGPARLVSMSLDPSTRNFTLGQSGDALAFRVRTPAMGLNGNRGRTPTWPGVFTDTQPRHLVVTCANGRLSLFVAGKPLGDDVLLYSNRMLLGIDWRIGDYLATAILFLPASVLGVIGWNMQRRRSAAALAVFAGVLPWIAVNIGCAVWFNRALEAGPMLFALAAAGIGAAVTARCAMMRTRAPA